MSKPTRPTVAEIDLKALAGNLHAIRRKVGRGVRLMGVVKANAYGHGILEVSRYLERQRIDYLGVANAEEGVALRESGIKTPVHVFTLPSAEQAVLPIRYDLEPTICSEDDAGLLNKHAQRAKRTISVHLKLDTGMNRIGVRVGELAHLVSSLGSMRRIEIKGVYTHFATADWNDKSFTRRQLAEFHRGLEILHRSGVEAEHVHCAGSAAILDLPEAYFSMVRPGIMMYGYFPSHETTESVKLKPVLSLKSRISLVKWIEQGESVSYGRRFIAPRRTKIATLPLGYADGYFRLLTGRSFAIIAGKKFPVVGTICMDQLMVDVGTHDVRPGDEAVFIGRQGKESITAWDLASAIGTIPYEVCTNISSRVPRIWG
ncbi:MAG: alanine racemase [Ignavibacteria bacterium GWA2_54_16]|nr:MAG: alanine racemase [Ignavibacteria bacterium GWA2_54_16]